jgi:hypothetical protein
MSQDHWTHLTSLSDMPAAQSLVDALIGYGVPARMESAPAFLGEVRDCRVLVDSSLLHRARWFLAQGEISDAELDFLATGRLPSGEGQ